MNQTSDRRLLAALADEGAATVPQLAALLESHPVAVDRRCYVLQADGYVRQLRGGLYTLTDAGEQHLATVRGADQ